MQNNLEIFEMFTNVVLWSLTMQVIPNFCLFRSISYGLWVLNFEGKNRLKFHWFLSKIWNAKIALLSTYLFMILFHIHWRVTGKLLHDIYIFSPEKIQNNLSLEDVGFVPFIMDRKWYFTENKTWVYQEHSKFTHKRMLSDFLQKKKSIDDVTSL